MSQDPATATGGSPKQPDLGLGGANGQPVNNQVSATAPLPAFDPLGLIKQALEQWLQDPTYWVNKPEKLFASDEIWAKIPPQYVPSDQNAKGGKVRSLTTASYITRTTASTRATTANRKSSRTPLYAFGPAIAGSTVPTSGTADGSWPYLNDELRNDAGKLDLGYPLQRILHGCPGSGKSFRLQEQAKDAHWTMRTVFHPTTTFADFVGSLRPLSIYRKLKPGEVLEYDSPIKVTGEPTVLYVVQPGPLLKAYHLACENPDDSVVLIIEEMSRAVAAQVFGDIFQLLDRLEKPGSDGAPAGYSEYVIEPRADISAWLSYNEVDHEHVSPGRMRLPNNLYIWTTVNRSDQNAKQMDSAFLRRWRKEYLSYDEACNYGKTNVKYGGLDIPWDDLRNAVNRKLLNLGGVPEDKLIGPYFLKESDLSDPKTVGDELWGYLWMDVLKSRASEFFTEAQTFQDVRAKWDNGKGAPIGTL